MRLQEEDRVLTPKGTGVVMYVGWNFVDILLDGEKYVFMFDDPPVAPAYLVKLEPEEP